MAVTDCELARLADLQSAGAIDGAYPGDHVPGFRAIAAGIHGQRAADGSRDAGQKFPTFQVVNRRNAGDLRIGDASLGINLGHAGVFFQQETLQRVVGKDHGSAQSAIPDQKIAAQADEHDRLLRRQSAEEYAQVIEIGRKIGPINAAARAPTHVAAHRFRVHQLAPQSALPDVFQLCHIHAC